MSYRHSLLFLLERVFQRPKAQTMIAAAAGPEVAIGQDQLGVARRLVAAERFIFIVDCCFHHLSAPSVAFSL